MSKIWLYNISKEDIILYHNMVGCLSIKDEIITIQTKISKFKDLSPLNKNKNLPQSTSFVDFHARYYLERLYTDFDDSITGTIEKYQYKKAYLGIVGAALNLNLLEEGSNDYKTYFERLNSVLGLVLSSLNNMEIEDVIKLYDIIKSESRKDIEKYLNTRYSLVLLLLLSMTDDMNIMDYQIFAPDNEIDIDSLYNLVRKNKRKKLRLVVDTYKLRPSYKDICEM